MSPDVDHLVIAFAVGDQSLGILPFDLRDLMLSLPQQFLLLGRNMHVVDADRDTGTRGILEPRVLNLIEERDGLTVTTLAIDGIDELGHFLLGHELIRVGERQSWREHVRQDDSPDGGLNEVPLDPHLNPRMLFQFSRIKRNAHFLR